MKKTTIGRWQFEKKFSPLITKSKHCPVNQPQVRNIFDVGPFKVTFSRSSITHSCVEICHALRQLKNGYESQIYYYRSAFITRNRHTWLLSQRQYWIGYLVRKQEPGMVSPKYFWISVNSGSSPWNNKSPKSFSNPHSKPQMRRFCYVAYNSRFFNNGLN
jgi:hypothetical protein